MNQSDGSQFYGELQRAAQRLASAMGTLEAGQAPQRAEFEALVRARRETLAQLAAHYLPNLSKETISQPFAELEGELAKLLKAKEARQLDLVEALAQGNSKREALETRLAQTTRRLDDLVERREALEAELALKLASDGEFKTLSEQAAQAEATLTKNEERRLALDREAQAKLPAYEADRLFQYLYRRGYGRPGYPHRGLVRRLDRWVAGRVAFDEQRRGYDFLRAAPALVAQELERRHGEFEALMQQVETLRDRFEQALGLDPVRAEGAQVGAERDAQVAELGQQLGLLSNLAREQAELELNQGRYYTEALERTGEVLARTEQSVLEAQARRTPDPRDDALVTELERLSKRSAQLERELGTSREDLQRAQTRLRALLDLQQRYRTRNFDAGRSVLEGGAPTQELTDFEAGQSDVETLWRAIETRQRFRPPPLPQQMPQGLPRTLPGAPAGPGWGGPGRPAGFPAPRPNQSGPLAPDLYPRGGSAIGQTVINLVALALRASMARGIGRRGPAGGWHVDLGFPGRLGLPSSSSRGSSSRSSKPASAPKPPTRPRGGGFSTREGF